MKYSTLLFAILLWACESNHADRWKQSEKEERVDSIRRDSLITGLVTHAKWLDSTLISDSNYYLIKVDTSKGVLVAGSGAWALSNRCRYLLDSIYKFHTMKKKTVYKHLGDCPPVGYYAPLDKTGTNYTAFDNHLAGEKNPPIGPIIDPRTYEDPRYAQGWNAGLVQYNDLMLIAAEDAMERFRQDLESKQLFTKEVKEVWDRHYNYLKNYQIR